MDVQNLCILPNVLDTSIINQLGLNISLVLVNSDFIIVHMQHIFKQPGRYLTLK